MHPSTTLPATLLGLLLSSASMASAISDRLTCVRENAGILVQAAACGNEDPVRLQECFLSIPDIVTTEYLQSCFVESGCTIAEATSEATTILQSCDASVSIPELRRRNAAPAETSPTPTPTPAPDAKNSSSGSITTSGIIVSVVLAVAAVITAAVVLFYYLRERKARALARAQAEEDKRKRDEADAEAARRTYAQDQVRRERERRQQREALEWAQRRGSPRYPENPFDDRSAA
ncbi:hypothetical protein F5B22DRAFT_660196 [Xylaria bambusicola]|uniref:uncharacterized protein n=1 Tax=Xylaria bambusicola TaxID=326684 RepID=UPI002008A9EB|nr:uncharacterized protein F5B22DRAFT_660196 [Xylaria bambusicola]KAI0506559.1 hypothetical protein F5B22DRAFT_660196 [Xylaria bambusicola]